jgi:hypothetical protein
MRSAELTGQFIALRARTHDDAAILHAQLYEDVATRMRTDLRPGRPG